MQRPTILIGLTTLAAAAVALGALVAFPALTWQQTVLLLALGAAATLSEFFPVPIERVALGSQASLATIFISATAALLGWQAAAWVGLLAMAIIEVARKSPARMLVYNVALYTLGGAAAGAAASVLPEGYRIGLLAASTFYVVNITLLGAIIALSQAKSFAPTLARLYGSTFLPFTVMASLTGILMVIYDQNQFLSLLIVPPLVAIATYQRWLHAMFVRREELDRMKDEFIAVVSHELRTPLAAVAGAAVTLKTRERDLSRATKAELIEMMSAQAMRLNTMIEEVLFVNRKEQPVPDIYAFSVREVVEEVAAASAAFSPGHEIEVKVNGSVALGNPQSTHRILQNLLENAIKYSPQGGKVSVKAYHYKGKVRFVVADLGIGIPRFERENVFGKFYRLDPTMTQGISGTGLGLYIARVLAEQMGGTVWAEQNRPRGTRMVFELPTPIEGVA
jgi:signal transduction histidine kinase